jgi:release factor glutamine methyltransferase
MRRRGLARGASVLDLFTGSGALAIAAAKDGAVRTTAADISRRAVANARLNALVNRVPTRVVRGDMFDPLAGERFDLILANPPYVPSESAELPSNGISRAWDAGPDGRALIDPLCADAPTHLNPGGSVLIVQSSLAGETATLAALAEAGLEPKVRARERGPLGPIVAARAEMLERRGLLAAGAREEEMLVIEGRRA